MFDQASTDHERAFVYQYLSLCSFRRNDDDQAKKFAYEALDYASRSHEELLCIEINILLARIYFKLKDFQRAEEYIKYARNLKDQLGDFNQMKELDKFLFEIKNYQEDIVSTIPIKTEDLTEQWISSAMQEKKNDPTIAEIQPKDLSHWQILTPYHHLLDICTERQQVNRRTMGNFKSMNLTPSTSLPLVSTNRNVPANI